MDDSARVTAKQFHDSPGTAGWHVLHGGAQTVFPTGDFAPGAAFVARIAEVAAEVGRDPDVDLRREAVVVRTAATPTGRLDELDPQLARRVSEVAAELGLRPDPAQLHTIQLAVAQAEGNDTREFWKAALGYEDTGSFVADPLRRGPRIWFDEIREPRRGRGHLDVAVPNARARERVEAMVAAGGRLADDRDAPDWWVLASLENHGVDIAAWVDIDDGG